MRIEHSFWFSFESWSGSETLDLSQNSPCDHKITVVVHRVAGKPGKTIFLEYFFFKLPLFWLFSFISCGYWFHSLHACLFVWVLSKTCLPTLLWQSYWFHPLHAYQTTVCTPPAGCQRTHGSSSSASPGEKKPRVTLAVTNCHVARC